MWEFFGAVAAALVPIVIWEAYLRPSRRRLNVARLLHAETALNLRRLMMVQEYMRARPHKMPADLGLSIAAFDALKADSGELPASLLAQVVKNYLSLNLLTTHADAYVRLVDRLDRPEGARDRITFRIQGALFAFTRTSSMAIDELSGTLLQLDALIDRLELSHSDRRPTPKELRQEAQALAQRIIADERAVIETAKKLRSGEITADY